MGDTHVGEPLRAALQREGCWALPSRGAFGVDWSSSGSTGGRSTRSSWRRPESSACGIIGAAERGARSLLLWQRGRAAAAAAFYCSTQMLLPAGGAGHHACVALVVLGADWVIGWGISYAWRRLAYCWPGIMFAFFCSVARSFGGGGDPPPPPSASVRAAPRLAAAAAAQRRRHASNATVRMNKNRRLLQKTKSNNQAGSSMQQVGGVMMIERRRRHLFFVDDNHRPLL